MKPRICAESRARTTGKEARKFWQQGPGAAKAAREFTLRQAHRAMRAQDKQEVSQGLTELGSEDASAPDDTTQTGTPESD